MPTPSAAIAAAPSPGRVRHLERDGPAGADVVDVLLEVRLRAVHGPLGNA